MAPRTWPAGMPASITWAITVFVIVATWVGGVRPASAASDRYDWPVRGPVIHPYEEPSGPYGPGHRGIDIAVPFGTELHAAQAGVVAFAGWVGGSLFISIDHADGIRTTYSWLSSVSVRRGNPVSKGQVIGATGHGHPEEATPHLHFGARIGAGRYIDPMTLLGGVDLVHRIHLAPLGRASPASAAGASPVEPARYPAVGPAGVSRLQPARYPAVLALGQRARDPPEAVASEHQPAPTIAAA